VLLSRILKGNNDPANEEDTNRRRRRTRRRTIEIFVLFLDHWIHDDDDDDEDCTASPNAPTGIDEAISCCRFVRFPAKHVVNGGGGGGGGGGTKHPRRRLSSSSSSSCSSFPAAFAAGPHRFGTHDDAESRYKRMMSSLRFSQKKRRKSLEKVSLSLSLSKKRRTLVVLEARLLLFKVFFFFTTTEQQQTDNTIRTNQCLFKELFLPFLSQ